MPELPEVETIRRDLQAVLPGRTIRRIQVDLPKMVKLPLRTFRRRVTGTTVMAVHRRAKLLLVHLRRGWTIIIHLKMSGQLIWRSRRGKVRVGGHPIPHSLENLPNKYSHVVFSLTGGTLYFNDQRQFGFVKLIATAKLDQWLIDQGYGPEPLADDFLLDHWFAILRRHEKKRIKPLLLDQTAIAGIGNIYADEACFAARVRPTRRVRSLNLTERRALYLGLRAVMELSLRNKGTTANAYRTASGQKGEMLPFLKVYGRGGQRCQRCGGIIKKITLVGRGTHYCPDCQD